MAALEHIKVEPLIEGLGQARAEGHRITAWSVYFTESRRMSLGVKDRQAGSPHSPLTLAKGASARYLVVWDDDLISRGVLERRQFEQDARTAIETARKAAYSDPDAAHVAGPAQFPEVPLHDEPAAQVAGGGGDVLAQRLGRLRERMDHENVRTWSGSFSAGEARARLLTSAGLDVGGIGTSIGWWANVDGEFGDGHSARRREDDVEFESRLDRLFVTAAQLREDAPPLPAGKHRVLLAPRVVESYALDTLLHHLEGATIDHGEGHFARDAFGSDRPVLREDLGLTLDPLRPYCSGSYRFTSEGVPATVCTYLERGRLIQPILDLKYARRLALDPTPIPYDSDALAFTGEPHLTLEQAWGEADAMVLSVLGVHTQDTTSGDFSLSAPQTLRIDSGGPSGRLRTTISGNLFELLRSPDLAFVSIPGETTPALLVSCRLDPK